MAKQERITEQPKKHYTEVEEPGPEPEPEPVDENRLTRAVRRMLERIDDNLADGEDGV